MGLELLESAGSHPLDATAEAAEGGLTMEQNRRLIDAGERKEMVDGIQCTARREKFPDGMHDVYTFTVPGWKECSVTGKRAAKRVIHGMTDPAVRNTMGIRW